MRSVLRGHNQFAQKRGSARPAAQSFLGGNARYVRIVIVLGKMSEHDVSRVGIEALRIGQEFADCVIREVSRAAHHALLDVPGIWANLQHFKIVVGFQHQAIGFTQMKFHELGQVAEVGDDGDFRPTRAESESQGIDGVMRNRKWRDFNIADDEPVSGADVFHMVEALLRALGQNAVYFGVRGFGEIHRGAPLAEDLREAANMIAMFVRDHDAVESVDQALDCSQPPQRFFFAETRIHQETRPLGFEQRAIARAA